MARSSQKQWFSEIWRGLAAIRIMSILFGLFFLSTGRTSPSEVVSVYFDLNSGPVRITANGWPELCEKIGHALKVGTEFSHRRAVGVHQALLNTSIMPEDVGKPGNVLASGSHHMPGSATPLREVLNKFGVNAEAIIKTAEVGLQYQPGLDDMINTRKWADKLEELKIADKNPHVQIKVEPKGPSKKIPVEPIASEAAAVEAGKVGLKTTAAKAVIKGAGVLGVALTGYEVLDGAHEAWVTTGSVPETYKASLRPLVAPAKAIIDTFSTRIPMAPLPNQAIPPGLRNNNSNSEAQGAAQ